MRIAVGTIAQIVSTLASARDDSCGSAAHPKDRLIPRLVHQLWVGPAAASFGDSVKAKSEEDAGGPSSPQLQRAIDAWRQKARTATPCVWEYRLWNRSSAEALIGEVSQRVLDKFRSLAAWPERQKDLFQFFVLGHLGGLFVDVDVLPLLPLGAWPIAPDDFSGRRRRGRSIRLLVGVEAQGNSSEVLSWRWASGTQLAMWAIASAPDHPTMLRAVSRILEAPLPPKQRDEQYKQSISLGPGLLTNVVSDWLQEVAVAHLGRLGSVRRHARVATSADTMVLGINGFGCGQPHSSSKPCNTSAALVQHLFFGGWKIVDRWEWEWDFSHGGRRRRSSDEVIDWRLPGLALHAHLNVSGLALPWEVVLLLFSGATGIIPSGPPLLPAPS